MTVGSPRQAAAASGSPHMEATSPASRRLPPLGRAPPGSPIWASAMGDRCRQRERDGVEAAQRLCSPLVRPIGGDPRKSGVASGAGPYHRPDDGPACSSVPPAISPVVRSATRRSRLVVGVSIVAYLAALSTPWVSALPQRQGDVRIAHGTLGSYEWMLSVRRGHGPKGGRRPCLVTTTGFLQPSHPMPVSRLAACGSLHGTQLVVANSSREGLRERTLLGLAFPSGVVTARIWLRGHGDQLLRLKLLGVKQAAVARVVQFRYAALPISGLFCLRRFVGYDESGAIVAESGPLFVLASSTMKASHGVS
jgi:hypothetical protein